MCAQRRLKSACVSAQSDQSLRYPHEETLHPWLSSEDSDQAARIRKVTLRKHAYSNILKFSPPKNENFQIKNSDIFHISAQNIDCGYSLEPPRGGGSNEYPQSMF